MHPFSPLVKTSRARMSLLAASAAGAAALAAAVITSAVPYSPVAPVAVAPAAHPNAIEPWLTVKPGIIPLFVTDRQGPLSTAKCQQTLGFACYQPGQIRDAYSLPYLYARHIDGRHETIVIVDSYGSPTIRHDLIVFDREYHYPAPPVFKIVTPAGKIPAYNGANATMVSWAAETTLDVEYAHALAPGAMIVLAETPVAETEGVQGFPQIEKAEEWLIKHHIGDVISQSFSATEQTFASAKKLAPLRAAYTDAYKHRITVLATSGDSGATDVGLNQITYYTHPVTSWPDSDPLVTAVGGTELVEHGKTDKTYSSVAWNDTYNRAVNEYFDDSAGPSPFASGGGKSIFFARPSYQNGVKSVVGTRRGVPDISMSGACSAPVNIYSSFAGSPAGWSLICGTSESVPEFAAIVALADQVAGHPLGLINPRLYQLSAEHAPGIVDVTSGNNTVSFYQGVPYKKYTVKGFAARRGYDLVTGVGTIYAPKFVYELAGVNPPRS
jgi:subtilase family serine protease